MSYLALVLWRPTKSLEDGQRTVHSTNSRVERIQTYLCTRLAGGRACGNGRLLWWHLNAFHDGSRRLIGVDVVVSHGCDLTNAVVTVDCG